MIDEIVLIERAQRGEVSAFRDLVERYKINIYRLAYDLTGNHLDAEDLSQDVFIKAYRSLHAFRGESKLGTWLYRIAVNAGNDYRSRKPRAQVELDDEVLDPTDVPAHVGVHSPIGPDRLAASRMIQEDIERALEHLSPRERSVFVLRHYHDLPLKEIAAALEISEGTVKSLLFRALKRLQQQLVRYKKDAGYTHE